jgi:hypothetical protein
MEIFTPAPTPISRDTAGRRWKKLVGRFRNHDESLRYETLGRQILT